MGLGQVLRLSSLRLPLCSDIVTPAVLILYQGPSEAARKATLHNNVKCSLLGLSRKVKGGQEWGPGPASPPSRAWQVAYTQSASSGSHCGSLARGALAASSGNLALSGGDVGPLPGHIRQCLESYLVVTSKCDNQRGLTGM